MSVVAAAVCALPMAATQALATQTLADARPAPGAGCGASTFVAGWAASPTDSITPIDAYGGVVPLRVQNQTFRMVITPHVGGDRARVRLTNRYGLGPVTFGHVTLAAQTRGAGVGAVHEVRFGGRRSVTIPAGTDVMSDPVVLPVTAFTPLSVSMYVPGVAGPPTKHWNANATSYYAPSGSGDLTARASDAQLSLRTGAWFYVDALDVAAPAGTGAVVAFGDSITDGYVGSSVGVVPAASYVADRNVRYPDFLQRRLIADGIPISVVNAGIGSNRLLTSGEPLMLGAKGVDRFRRDALALSGVTGILLLQGINDLGIPPTSTAGQMIEGYQRVIAMTLRSGKKIWLGTILPASDAIVDGVATSPASEATRQQINAWIRRQKLATGVVDFDARLRDSRNPSVMDRRYAGPDNLHPNPLGYDAMAQAVPLPMLQRAGAACR